jgi:hypothetical protein
VDIEMMGVSCPDPELKEALGKLADTVKYPIPFLTRR